MGERSGTSTPPGPRVRTSSAPSLPRSPAPDAAAAPGAGRGARREAERDIRRKRPPVLSFLLRMATLRRVARVSRCSRWTSPAWRWRSSPRCCSRKPSTARSCRAAALHETRTVSAVRLPAHRAAVRALGPVRRARPATGAVADRRLAVPGRVRRADLRGRQRRTLLQLLPLLRLARVRASSTSRRCAPAYERLTGVLLRAAGYRRRAVLVGPAASTSATWRTRCVHRPAPADRGRRLPRAERRCRTTACARWARSPTSSACWTRRGSTR